MMVYTGSAWVRTTPTSGEQTNINTVSGIAANVTTVAGVAANVTTVAGISANVTTVAGISTDVTTAATNVADITNFADVYIGPSASDPTVRADASALQVGDMYFNTGVDGLRVYSGSQWVAGTAGTLAVQRYSGDGSTVAFTLATAPAGENNTQVYVSGVYQQKDTYSVSGVTLTFSAAPPSGTNNIEVVTISTLALGETDASLVTYTPAGTGAVERTVQSVLRDTVSVTDFGAVGDGATNDTAAFTALEVSNSGRYVDLNGLVYVVTAIPTEAKYYNGDFIVGSTKVSLRRNRLDNPLDGESTISFGDGQTHYWFFDMVYVASTGVLMAFITPAWRHAQSYSSPLNVIYSDDKGQTWGGEKTIHTVDSFNLADVAATIMGSNRIGLLVTARDSSNAYRNDFVYSDNNGTDWTVSESVVASPNGFLVYGTMLPYPASAGGHATTGFIVYGYEANDCHYAKTVDNGASWTVAEIFVDAALSEPSIVRVGTEDKWVAFIRKNSANLRIATSTNMTTWTTPEDTGLDLGSNPVQAIVDGGSVYVYMFIRDIDASIAEQNDVLLIEDDISAVYTASDLTNTNLRQVLTGVERALGYVSILKVGQDFLWGYTAGEHDGSSSLGGSSFIVFGSTRRKASVSIGAVRQLMTNKNLIRNPTFDFWSRGTSIAGITTNTKAADGWLIGPSGSTITVSQQELAVEDSRALPFRGRYAMDISATANDYISLSQTFYGESELYRFADKNVTIQVWGLGDMGGTQTVTVLFDYGGGGSADVSTSVNLKVTEGTNKTWVATATVPTATLEGKTIGTDPFVKIIFGASASAAWDVQICGVKAEFGTYASTFEPIELEEERARSAKFVQLLSFGSLDQMSNGFSVNTTAFWGVFHYPEMRSSPTVSLETGLAADFEVYPDAAYGTSVAYSQINKSSFSMRVTTTGLTSREGGIARVKSGRTIELLLDTE
tara:strand:- start:176 stop:3034 length:2859 start_codon:yes stop_codon:yes gene_type:complete